PVPSPDPVPSLGCGEENPPSGGEPVQEEASLAQLNHDSIQAKVDAIAKKYGAVGLQVAVVEDGVVTDTYVYGWATKKTDPMTADHKMRVASISKVLVGMGAMILREEGVVNLDDSIGNYWGFTVRNPYHTGTPVSIRSLLTHTSSIYIAGDKVSREYQDVRNGLKRGSVFTRSKPGALASWGYNNYGFVVLGMTLELAADDNLDNILHRRLFDAMDIDAAFFPGDMKDTSRLVTLYSGGKASYSIDYQKSLRAAAPAATGKCFPGGLTISAADLGKLAAMLAKDGQYGGVQLLSAESVELMESHADQMITGGFYQGMPLRCRPGLYGRDSLCYHTGSAYGVYNLFSYDPVTGDGVVVLTVGASGKKDGNGIYAVCGEISSYIYGVIA
ncbi:MAG: beta-lactamase family protein, partial [Oscillospiraceae bacterium]|nr:beta-lactamase family protein [Oscillospiraceae bacterium]